MRKLSIFTVIAFILIVEVSPAIKSQIVEFKNQEDKKIEVFIGGKFFTAFIYPDNMEKQVLYPITTASGKIITRGYPMQPRPFERTDHPHHVGLWLNFGDVNGLDFWNNSFAVKPEDKPKFGSIKFKEIVSVNPGKGELVTSSEWVDYNDKALLKEETDFVFFGKGNLRTIERTTKLTALQQVTFTDCKEGLLGLRLDRAFEEPATKPVTLLDAMGVEAREPILHNEGVNGVYRNADGIRGADVWGKRSRWVALRAVIEGEAITIVILDNPNNPNYPAWSHARGYGLFAINNMGGRAFDKDAQAVKMVLNPGESILLKHKIIIGGDLTDSEINGIVERFK
jgi:hypothetical protein